MKRLLLVLLLLVPATLSAAPADRDVLLTPGGTLYTIQAPGNHTVTSANASTRYLTLTVQSGEKETTTAVPASTVGGNHRRPKLAYDAETETLFVFWLRSRHSVLATSDLVFCSLKNGVWTDAIVVDDTPYRNRSNFSVAVSRKAEVTDGRLNVVTVSALTLHLVWWNESGDGNSAYYASVGIDEGSVEDIKVRPLSDFVDGRFETGNAASPDSIEIFRHPTVFESPNHDTVDVVFGDATTNRFHRTTIKTLLTRPEPNLRVRITIGVKDRRFRGPERRLTNDSASLSALPAGENGVIFYAEEPKALKYVAFRDGVWSDVVSIALGTNLSAEAAVSALRRMAAAE